MSDQPAVSFADLALAPAVLDALDRVGYEHPTPIQAATIPALLNGRDVLGQAQTGTGKTAAFALPLVSRLQRDDRAPVALILTPTRELAIQVAEAITKYAAAIGGFRVLPVYGGADYRPQLRGLQRGVDIVVGTPGRVMDHMRRGSLDVSALQALVLDEADEMLRMGFIDDVEWVLEQTPDDRQIALFSATMPRQVKTIADRYLRDPVHVQIESKATTAVTINQRYLIVNARDKAEAFTRLLETMDFDGMIVFVRTKHATVDVADRLAARGYAAAAMNGDLGQDQREQTINKLKKGRLDIIVATDVAARGLDVDRISHVINYDLPHDPEAYVHRIGRTGRAGRSGEAIMFVQPRERRMLKVIERVGGRDLEAMDLPTVAEVNANRKDRIKQRILATAESGDDMSQARALIAQLSEESELSLDDIAAALLQQLHGDDWLLTARQEISAGKPESRERRKRDHGPRGDSAVDEGWARYSVAVGRKDNLKPGNLVGAIANEIDVDSKFIGRIDIYPNHTLVDLPADLPTEALEHLKGVWVCQKQLKLRPATEADQAKPPAYKGRPNKPGGFRKAGKGKRKPYSGAGAKGRKKPFKKKRKSNAER